MSDTNLPVPRLRVDAALHGEWAARSALLAITPKPRVRWRQRLHSAEPLTDDLLLSSTDGDNTVVVDDHTGEILWTIPRAIPLPLPQDEELGDVFTPDDQDDSSIIVRDGLLLRRSWWRPSYRGYPIAVDAFDARTGIPKWRVSGEEEVKNSATKAGSGFA